jgi:hypothetical protein
MASTNPASGRQGRLPVVPWVLAAVVVAVVGVGGWLLLAPDDDDRLEIDSARTPDETVQAFITLFDDSPCEALITFWTERRWTELANSRAEAIDVCERQSEAEASGDDDGGYPDYVRDGPFEVQSQEGDNARVVVEFDEPDDAGNLAQVWVMARENGEWRIDDSFTT